MGTIFIALGKSETLDASWDECFASVAGDEHRRCVFARPIFHVRNAGVFRVMADPVTFFYSWQSDLPNRTNRGFIKEAIERAAKSIRNDDSLNIEPRIDHDTLGLPGSPEIHTAIFEKIDRAACAVFDVSVVRKDSILKAIRGKRRFHPNPNVLVELGYALKTLGTQRVITVMNLTTGEPDDLPFDIKQKKVIGYEMGWRTKPADPRKGLVRDLELQFRSVLELPPRTLRARTVTDEIADLKTDGLPNIILRTKKVGEPRGLLADRGPAVELFARLLQEPEKNEVRFGAGRKQADRLKHLRLATDQFVGFPSWDSQKSLWELRVNANYFAERKEDWVITEQWQPPSALSMWE